MDTTQTDLKSNILKLVDNGYIILHEGKYYAVMPLKDLFELYKDIDPRYNKSLSTFGHSYKLLGYRTFAELKSVRRQTERELMETYIRSVQRHYRESKE